MKPSPLIWRFLSDVARMPEWRLKNNITPTARMNMYDVPTGPLHLEGWHRVCDGGFKELKVYQVRFYKHYSLESDWQTLAFHDRKDIPPCTMSAWQRGPGGQGFSDIPTHWREVPWNYQYNEFDAWGKGFFK